MQLVEQLAETNLGMHREVTDEKGKMGVLNPQAGLYSVDKDRVGRGLSFAKLSPGHYNFHGHGRGDNESIGAGNYPLCCAARVIAEELASR